MSNPRLLVIMGDSSSLELVEEFAPGSGNRTKYFTNSVTEVQLDEGAQLDHGLASCQSSMCILMWLLQQTRQLLVMYGCKTQNSCLVRCILCIRCRGRQQACNIIAAVLDAPAVSKVRSCCQPGG